MTPLEFVLPPVPDSVGYITPRHTTAHYWGGSPWPAWVDRSSPEAFQRSAPHSMCPDIVRGGHSFHVNGRGWLYFAYNEVGCPHGVRYDGRGPRRRTAAQGTNVGNDRSAAVVALIGDGDPLTEPCKRALLDAAARQGAPLDRKHADWISTSCGGPEVNPWVDAGAVLSAPRPAPAPSGPGFPDLTVPQLNHLIQRSKEGPMLYIIGNKRYLTDAGRVTDVTGGIRPKKVPTARITQHQSRVLRHLRDIADAAGQGPIGGLPR